MRLRRIGYSASFLLAATIVLPHLDAVSAAATDDKVSQAASPQRLRRSLSQPGPSRKRSVTRHINFLQPDTDVLVRRGDNIFRPVIDRPGVVAILNQDIYNDDRTTVIGRVSGTCTRIQAGTKYACSGTYEFLSGDKGTYPSPDTISVMGSFYDDTDSAVTALAGGTGEYDRASGRAQYTTMDGGWNRVTIWLDDK